MDPLLGWAALAGALMLVGGVAATLGLRASAAGPVVSQGNVALDRRRARDIAITEGIVLAVEMSRVDGEVHALEMNAIHDFITTHVKRADAAFAAKMMRGGLERPRDPAAVSQAIERIREAATEEQVGLVVDLLVFVAQADGVIHPLEVGFMEEVGEALGLAREDLAARLEITPA